LFGGIYLCVRECVFIENIDINGGNLIETDILHWTRNLEEIRLEPVIDV
jgi:hypothetical protein